MNLGGLFGVFKFERVYFKIRRHGMDLEKIVKRLELMLQNPLPGRLGQITMSPQPIDEKRFVSMIRDDHRKGAVLMLFYRCLSVSCGFNE